VHADRHPGWPNSNKLGRFCSWRAGDLPVPDCAQVETLMGTYTGLRQIAVSLGFIIGPILGGSLVEALGNAYRRVWLITV
jgi:hypothetical protein